MSSTAESALEYPFMRAEFIQALETSASACADTGWEPIHLSLNYDDQDAFMPLYLKDHSMGEYVFDYAWANAYHQNGLDYYPKLLTAVPFTPSEGPRVRGSQAVSEDHCQQLFEEVLAVAAETGASSWHCLFPDSSQRALFDDPRLLQRSGVQYHWQNRDYQSFDDYLAALNSRKRKMVRKERAEVAAQGLNIEVLEGAEISPTIWQLFYQLYERTYAKRNGTRGYLTQDFFNQIASSMPEQIAMAVAYHNEIPVACALYFFDSETLYGRYWGSAGEFSYLHFELCYYSGIEFAIAKGLQKYDAGAQGEHKIIRGFEPITTQSLHWIQHPQFHGAIERFLQSEQASVQKHLQQAREILPYRKTG
ncbi:GNAT family N-acetyltransferase [Porticoccaceae bacterium]|nr:GNAT family N-acetyltransferase [Porticoccaceae bacterium]